MRTLYLQNNVTSSGHHALKGRNLFDNLDAISEESLLSCVVISDQELQTLPLYARNDFLSESQFRRFNPNFIYVEGSLFYRYSKDEWRWKIPRSLLKQFIFQGAVIIIADIDVNILRWQKALYREARDLLGVSAHYSVEHLNEDDSEHPVYGIDQTNNWDGVYNIICKPNKMLISDWIYPIYNNVSQIIVGSPCWLHCSDIILASGNSDTTAILHQDRWVDKSFACPFASAQKFGNGYFVTIAGLVSHDLITQYCSDNITWLTNIAQFLLSQSIEDKRRRNSRYTSPHKVFLSHKSIDKEIVKQVAQKIGNKGIDYWIDTEQIELSDSLIEAIDNGLSKMTHFALFWSESCIDAPWVKMEFNVAVSKLIKNNIPIFIIKLDKTEVPTIIQDKLYINAYDESPEIVANKIYEAIENLSNRQVQN